MSPAPAASADRLLEYVRILAPLVEAERQSVDDKRELSPRLLDALHSSGLFRLWVPRRLGGAELDPVFVPADRCRIHDTWHATGLRGSAALAVDIAYRLGGAASVFVGNRIERCFRDVHTAAQHGALAPRTLELVGQARLGMGSPALL